MPDPQTHDRTDLVQPNAANRYEVTARDLPVCCPLPGMYLWNSHPRVYLPVHETGSMICPYCGATYVLKDDDRLAVKIGGQREWK
ncbi:MAG: zinc-finger domain-containing protein [Halorhodospira halophila]|uniref:zinc-finger domain-containing protein n=1 Tax=Halorhodospira halophila TaxID=1053 RepID=UPI0026F33D55|nr:zinc-finger domain-containing protein [Halorhodospira halophila]MCC3751620.1 zinc-finger domain-containing protein [Halorhodospira halophila]